VARKSKFSDAQIVWAIKEVEGGTPAKDVARRMGAYFQHSWTPGVSPWTRAFVRRAHVAGAGAFMP